jgi:hypothetical protein
MTRWYYLFGLCEIKKNTQKVFVVGLRVWSLFGVSLEGVCEVIFCYIRSEWIRRYNTEMVTPENS